MMLSMHKYGTPECKDVLHALEQGCSLRARLLSHSVLTLTYVSVSRRSSVTFRGASLDLHGLGIDEGIEEGSSAPPSHSRAMTTGPSSEAHVGMMLSEF